MIYDWDDFGSNHVMSAACRTRDCRKELDILHYANPNFKATLFAVPGEMTQELLDWCKANESWIELAFHGFFHISNYECEKMTAEEFNWEMAKFEHLITQGRFVKLFKAPGWQISEGAYTWLLENGWMIADQAYNNERRPKEIPAYVNQDGKFFVGEQQHEAWHGHVWDCCNNGIEETLEELKVLVAKTEEFKFVSEVLA